MTARHPLRYNEWRDGDNAMPDINDKVPDLKLEDENGKEVSLKDFRGKTVILFFFPKANTSG
jgi:thioredoxin-dependent peroxiredoxin